MSSDHKNNIMHNHTNSRSIAIRSGYDGSPNAAHYDGTGQMSEAEETALGHGTISHADDPNNGNYYIMINASGLIYSSL